MYDDRDPVYGELHVLLDTSQLAGGPAAQVASQNQGQLVPFVPTTSVRQRHNEVSQHNEKQAQWLEDNHANEACKNLVIKIVDKVYLEKLYNERFGYKGKTLRDFMDHLIDKYQATPEERAAVKALIDQPWDTNEHIVNLFSRLKKQLTILAEMKNSVPYPQEDFVEALYMAVQKTKQFSKACTKWKKKDVADRATEDQAREFFEDMYEVFDDQRDSLHDVGVANNVEMKEKMDKLEADNANMRHEMATQKAKNERYQMVVDQAMSMTRGTEETDDMTLQTQQWSAFSASQDQQMAAMRKQLEDLMSKTCPPATSPPSHIDTAPKDGGRKRRRGPLSDGPEGVTKTTKFYKTCDNACWSCGYDVSKDHDSTNCRKKKKGHIDSHTGDNPQPGASQKDKEFSKWK